MESVFEILESQIGISINMSDVIASVLGGFLLYLISRTAWAINILKSLGSVFFKSVRRNQIYSNSKQIINCIKDDSALYLLKNDVQNDRWGVIIIIIGHISVQLIQIQWGLNQIDKNLVQQTNTIMLDLVGNYGRYLKLAINLFMLFNFYSLLDNSYKLKTVLNIRINGIKYIAQEKRNRGSRSLHKAKISERFADRIAIILIFIMICSLFIYGYWFY